MAAPQPVPLRVLAIAPPDQLEQTWIVALRRDPHINLLARIGVIQRGLVLVQQLQPDVVVLDRSLGETEHIIRSIADVAPRTACVVLLDDYAMPVIRRLATAGAQDVLAKPIQYERLAVSLRQTIQSTRNAGTAPVVIQSAMPPGQVIAVVGAKGGVGTTTIAINLAIALRYVADSETALVDLDLRTGDAAVLLDLWSPRTLGDLIGADAPLSPALEHVLVRHNSGVDVVLAPWDTPDAATVDPQRVVAVVAALRARFGYVVLDCCTLPDDLSTTMARAADHVLLITTPEAPALKAAKTLLHLLHNAAIELTRVVLVLNRFPGVNDVRRREAERYLEMPLYATIPSDGATVVASINAGRPFVQAQSQTTVARAVRDLALRVAGDQIAPAAQATSTPEPADASRKLRWHRRSRRTTS